MEEWRRSWHKRLQAFAIAAVGYPLVNLLGHSLRWRVEGRHHFDNSLASGRQPVIALWHGRILPATFFLRGRGMAIITSESFDGEWIARILESFGYVTARGSTTRGGRKAMLQLVREMKRGLVPFAGFTLDGPRGPARVAQPGATWLAMATGNPVIPVHLEASSHWTLHSWDRAQIPKPFSTVALVAGEPIEVARDASAVQLEAARVELERRLAMLEVRAQAILQ